MFRQAHGPPIPQGTNRRLSPTLSHDMVDRSVHASLAC
jgi:hypothetical protein